MHIYERKRELMIEQTEKKRGVNKYGFVFFLCSLLRL